MFVAIGAGEAAALGDVACAVVSIWQQAGCGDVHEGTGSAVRCVGGRLLPTNAYCKCTVRLWLCIIISTIIVEKIVHV